MEGQVDEQVKNERSAALLAVDERLREAYIKENSDKILEVLAEEIVKPADKNIWSDTAKSTSKWGLRIVKSMKIRLSVGK